MNTEVQSLSISDIIVNSFKKTFLNWKTFLEFLMLPYLGVILGVWISILPPILLMAMYTKKGFSASPGAAVSVLICVLLGLAIFACSFWIYMVRSAACYNIAGKLIAENQVGSLEEAEKDISQRSGSYVKFLLWAALFGLVIFFVSMAILFLMFGKGMAATQGLVYYQRQFVTQILSVIAGVPFALSLASFVFNPELKPLNSIIKGLKLVAANFLHTLGFYALIWLMLSVINSAVALSGLTIMLIGAIPLTVAIILKAGAAAVALFGVIFVLIAIVAMLLMFAAILIAGGPLVTLFLTYWYSRLEAKSNTAQQQEGV